MNMAALRFLLSVLSLAAVANSVAGSSATVEQRRCFVCPRGQGPGQVEALMEAPAYADKCAQVLVEKPGVCTDLLKEDRLRALKDEKMAEADRLERKGDRRGTFARKLEVAILWNALRNVQAEGTEKLWGELMSTMDSEAQTLAGHGLQEEASRMLAAKEVAKSGRQSRLRGSRGVNQNAISIVEGDLGALKRWGEGTPSSSGLPAEKVATVEVPVVLLEGASGALRPSLSHVPRLQLPDDPLSVL